MTGQLEFYWDVHLWPRLQGLTDEEYLWEPAEGAWSVRPDASGRMVVDHQTPVPDPHRPLGPKGAYFADDSMLGLVVHVSREAIHHGAEICLLRDLYRAGAAGDRRARV